MVYLLESECQENFRNFFFPCDMVNIPHTVIQFFSFISFFISLCCGFSL